MWVYLALGVTYGFAAAVQPGPLLTYLVSQTLTRGWRRALPGCCAPLVSDGPIVLLALVVLRHVPPALVRGLHVLGGVFVLYLAGSAAASWRRFDPHAAPPTGSGRTSLLRATVVNLLNPSPYLGWTLVLGPLLLAGWREAPSHGIALVAGFYGTMIASMAAIVLLFHAGREAGPRVNRILIGLSALGLAGFGLYQLWLGLQSLPGHS
jgi:threonine/homoserine/homoserine lactone efflux protein